MKGTVLITGASRGLGNFLSHFFVSNNYEVIVNSQHDPKIWFRGSSVYGDLRNQSTIDELVTEAKRKNIDILINNAAQYLNETFDDVTTEEFQKLMDINFFAPFKLIKGCWPIFEKKQKGLIVNINSLAGLNRSKNEAAYCASKHALKGLSEAIKFDATKHNIRVLDIYLGAMDTDMASRKAEKEKLIDPKEAAKFIFDLCNNDYPSIQISSCKLTRRKY